MEPLEVEHAFIAGGKREVFDSLRHNTNSAASAASRRKKGNFCGEGNRHNRLIIITTTMPQKNSRYLGK